MCWGWTGPTILIGGIIDALFVGLSLLLAVVGIPYGPAAAYLPEIFKARYRYTGAGMGYHLAGILGGALPLVLAPPLTLAYGAIGVGWYLSALGLLSALCVLALRGTRDEVLDGLAPGDGLTASCAECVAGATLSAHELVSARPG